MKELVELLKQARQAKQVTLKAISDRTKIQMHYLEALEKGEFNLFAGEVYLKGALARYAESVDLDVKEVMALYHRLKGDNEPSVEEKPAAGLKKPQARPRLEVQGPSLVTGVILLVILIIAAGIWLASQRERPGDGTNLVENDNNEYGQTPGDSSQPEPEQPSSPVELILDRTSGTETVYTVRGAEQIELKMVFYANCWIHLVIDGEESLERTFHRGEEYPVTAARSIWLRLGHPPGVGLIFGDSEIEEVQQHERPHNFLFVLE